jgi:hypothetical protein
LFATLPPFPKKMMKPLPLFQLSTTFSRSRRSL